jgi:Uma2 family endonuclease
MNEMSATAMPVAGPARFSADEFAQMMASGAFEDMWVELVDGEIQRMPPPGNTHGLTQIKVLNRLLAVVPETLVRPEIAIEIGENTVLAGDTAVLSREIEADGPLPADAVALVVEVSVSTRDRDLGLKRRLYAAVAIPTYWVVDVERRLIHVFDRPEHGDYMGLALVAFGAPLAVPARAASIVIE